MAFCWFNAPGIVGVAYGATLYLFLKKWEPGMVLSREEKVIADPARMSLGSWWLIRYVNLLTAAEMVQCHILAAGIVLDDLVTGILVNGLFRWLMALPAGMHSNAKFGMPGTEEWLDPEVVCCVAIGSAYGPMANWRLQLLTVIGLVIVGVCLPDDGVLISSGISKLGLLMLYRLMYGTCWQDAGLLGAGSRFRRLGCGFCCFDVVPRVTFLIDDVLKVLLGPSAGGGLELLRQLLVLLEAVAETEAVGSPVDVSSLLLF
ncbi:hypothetical protein Nepgr_022917 [Nepenthes gracilis]|uniref:Uncharacterized protein n=1 Tax=Nepenthes gracilis TaxID=150966 RepID=A0AAD3XYL5_NEPGR|nr:hypothetical protein Nepgr_022917 [Nepenthes gracilis]